MFRLLPPWLLCVCPCGASGSCRVCVADCAPWRPRNARPFQMLSPESHPAAAQQVAGRGYSRSADGIWGEEAAACDEVPELLEAVLRGAHVAGVPADAGVLLQPGTGLGRDEP